MRRANSLEKTLMMVEIEGRRRRGWQRMRRLDGIINWMDMNLSMGLQRVGHTWANELNWTEPTCYVIQLTYSHFADEETGAQLRCLWTSFLLLSLLSFSLKMDTHWCSAEGQFQKKGKTRKVVWLTGKSMSGGDPDSNSMLGCVISGFTLEK